MCRRAKLKKKEEENYPILIHWWTVLAVFGSWTSSHRCVTFNFAAWDAVGFDHVGDLLIPFGGCHPLAWLPWGGVIEWSPRYYRKLDDNKNKIRNFYMEHVQCCMWVGGRGRKSVTHVKFNWNFCSFSSEWKRCNQLWRERERERRSQLRVYKSARQRRHGTTERFHHQSSVGTSNTAKTKNAPRTPRTQANNNSKLTKIYMHNAIFQSPIDTNKK